MARVGALWLQILVAVFGILWKLKEGYALLSIPKFTDISLLDPTNFEAHNLIRCLDILDFLAMKYVASDWPYFTLHQFLYLGQIFPLVLIAFWESLLRGGYRIAFMYVVNDAAMKTVPVAG